MLYEEIFVKGNCHEIFKPIFFKDFRYSLNYHQYIYQKSPLGQKGFKRYITKKNIRTTVHVRSYDLSLKYYGKVEVIVCIEFQIITNKFLTIVSL
jgi:hypothetical protein